MQLRVASFLGTILLLWASCALAANTVASSTRSSEVAGRINPSLQQALQDKNLTLGAPVLMRIFKETSELEVWLQAGKQFKLFKTYKICYFSGKLGPKTKEGDLQSPEGFYSVTPMLMTVLINARAMP